MSNGASSSSAAQDSDTQALSCSVTNVPALDLSASPEGDGGFKSSIAIGSSFLILTWCT